MTVPANLIANMMSTDSPAPAVLSSSAGQSTAAVRNHTVTLPSGIVAGDLIVLFFANDTTNTPNTPTGWTAINTQTFGASARVTAFFIQATGSMTSVTVSMSGVSSNTAAWVVRRISGHKDPLVQPPVIVGLANGTSTTPNPPSYTLPMKNYLLLACCAADGGSDVTGAPVGYSDQQTGDSGTGFGHVAASNAWREAHVGTEDPDTFTLASSDQWAAFSIIVYPAE